MVALTDALGRSGDGPSVALVSQGTMGAPTVFSAEPLVVRRVAGGRSRLGLALGLPLRRALAHLDGSGLLSPDLISCSPSSRKGPWLPRLMSPNLIHSHGVWHPANHWATRAARRFGVPLIIHPRGMLEPWALGQKAWKKRLALALFQRRDLDRAAAFVATSEMEYLNLRRLGLCQPVAVIPNGVSFPYGAEAEAETFEDGFPRVGGTLGCREGRLGDWDQESDQARERIALFLSRIHPKKGVLELIQAWSQVAPHAPAAWRLRLVGPDEGGHWSEAARLVDQLGVGAKVEYLGPVEGERKAALYREADLFVLPTFSENFGLVVAEALAYGVPVITTRGAPWADLETYGCGWWIETGVAPLAAALRAAMALSDAERAAMGARGRVYVRRYNWDVIAAETLALYRWVLGQGERPGCVRTD